MNGIAFRFACWKNLTKNTVSAANVSAAVKYSRDIFLYGYLKKNLLTVLSNHRIYSYSVIQAIKRTLNQCVRKRFTLAPFYVAYKPILLALLVEHA